MEYLDVNLDLTDEDIVLKEAACKFAREVIRPTAKALDEMTPDEAIAENSPLWPFFKKAYELGYHNMLLPTAVGGMGLNPLQVNMVMEELGWAASVWPSRSLYAASRLWGRPSLAMKS